MMIYSHGQYVDDIFFRQVGTYPADSLGMALSYFIGKLYQEGGDILFWEGDSSSPPWPGFCFMPGTRAGRGTRVT